MTSQFWITDPYSFEDILPDLLTVKKKENSLSFLVLEVSDIYSGTYICRVLVGEIKGISSNF